MTSSFVGPTGLRCQRCRCEVHYGELHVSLDWMRQRVPEPHVMEPEYAETLVGLCPDCWEEVRLDIEAAISGAIGAVLVVPKVVLTREQAEAIAEHLDAFSALLAASLPQRMFDVLREAMPSSGEGEVLRYDIHIAPTELAQRADQLAGLLRGV